MLDVANFPFDQQKCRVTLSSWAYMAQEVHTMASASSTDAYFRPNPGTFMRLVLLVLFYYVLCPVRCFAGVLALFLFIDYLIISEWNVDKYIAGSETLTDYNGEGDDYYQVSLLFIYLKSTN
jgi:hypothetical protein